MLSKYSDQTNEIKKDEIQEAANEIKNGNLVLFPTETVYGIGANALDTEAVKKIFIAKGRAQDNPLIVHVSNMEMVEKIVSEVTELEKRLIENFWPGPLTIIFNRKSNEIIPNVVTANLDTETSQQIMEKLLKMSSSMLVITHDISSRFLKQFDEVYQMKEGKINLIEKGGDL